jgi:hypothetical protein
MAAKWHLACDECGKKESFNDAKDIIFAKWKIIAWKVPSGEPKVLCPDCEYGKPKNKKKK